MDSLLEQLSVQKVHWVFGRNKQTAKNSPVVKFKQINARKFALCLL